MSSLNRWKIRLALIFLWAVTIVTPLVILPASISYNSGGGWRLEPVYFFIFGAYNPPGGSEPSGWLSGPQYLIMVIILLLFFIIYAFQISLYGLKPTKQRWAIISGLLSLIIPEIISIISVPVEVILGAAGAYVGPLPFQFIVGLVVMWIIKSGQERSEKGSIEEKASWLEEKPE